MAPKCKSSGAGNLDMLKRSRKALPLSEKVKVLNIRKKKKYAEIAKIYDENKSICKEREKFILVLFSQKLRSQCATVLSYDGKVIKFIP